jgi:AraC-like DNA-binding protein
MNAQNIGIINFYQVSELPGLELVKGMNVIHSFPRHSHRKYCIGIVDKGCRRFLNTNGEDYQTTEDILAINPDEVHTCGAVDNVGHTYRMLCLDPDYFGKLLPNQDRTGKKTPFFFTTKLFANPYLVKKLSYLFSILEESISVLKKESALLDTFEALILTQGYTASAPLGNEPGSIKLVREYLETNYAENVTSDQLSQLAKLSPYHLISVFREKTGLSPHAFQIQIRVKQAKIKLLQGQPIIDTALATGFVDQSHFTRFFKRMVGVTPGEFVKHQQYYKT